MQLRLTIAISLLLNIMLCISMSTAIVAQSQEYIVSIIPTTVKGTI